MTTTAFYRAARGGSSEIIQVLYDVGSDVNVRTWDSWTPIFEAIESSHDDVVLLLLKLGADINTRNSNSLMPLTFARCLRRDKIVEYLTSS